MTTPISDYIGNGYMSVPQALAFGEELDRLIVRKATGDIVFVADAQTGTPVEVMTWNNTGVTLMISGLTQLATIASGATNIVKLSIDSPTGQSVDLAQFLVNGSLKAKIDKDGGIYTTSGVFPVASDGAALGSTTYMWSDLFLASGAVINFNNGNCTLTHSAGILTLSGNLVVSGAGPHAIGGATDGGTGFYLRGTFDATGASAVSGSYMRLAPTVTVANTDDSRILALGGTLTKYSSGTHAVFATLGVAPPTIGGSGATVTNAASIYVSSAPTGATNNYALWVDAGTTRLDGDTIIPAGSKLYFDGGTHSYIQEYAGDVMHISAGGAVLYWNSGIGFYPASDNSFYLGYTSNRWVAVYAVNGTIQTSGRDTKQDIEASDLGLDFIMSLQPSKYTYKDEAAKGIRRHGLIAEDVIAAAKGKSLHGLLMEEQHKETGEMHLGLNYAGFVTPLIRAAQDHERRLAKIEALLNV